MALWRCQNERCSTDPHGRLIFDFEADLPICPKCETDGRATPNLIVRLKIMHFDPPHPRIANRGKRHAACSESLKVNGTTEEAFTGDAAIVNCKACMASSEWIKAAKERRILPERDFTVSLTNGIVSEG